MTAPRTAPTIIVKWLLWCASSKPTPDVSDTLDGLADVSWVRSLDENLEADVDIDESGAFIGVEMDLIMPVEKVEGCVGLVVT